MIGEDGEAQGSNAINELYVGQSDVLREFAGGAGMFIELMVALGIRYGGEHSFGGLHLLLELLQ